MNSNDATEQAYKNGYAAGYKAGRRSVMGEPLRKAEQMKWMVFYHDFNGDKIKTFNIFDHGGFLADVKKHLKKCEDKPDLARQLKRSLFYYFCSKCEWEIIIKPWCGSRNNEEIKVDVYEQVMNNWDIFLDYVWNSKRRKNVNEI